MSRVTLAALQAELDKVLKDRARLEVELKNATDGLQTAIRKREQAFKEVAELLEVVRHYKARRDALLGFIAGSREDRDKPGLTVVDELGNTRPRPTTLLDDFLDRMREDFSSSDLMTVAGDDYRRRSRPF